LAIRNFGTKHFFTHRFHKATKADVIEFLKARVATLEKEVQDAKPEDRPPLMSVLADCCAVLAEKCSTIGEKAHYHARAAENSLRGGDFEFIAEQAEKAADYYHFCNAEKEMIRYNAIAAMAWKNQAHGLPAGSKANARALHSSSERAQFAESLLWHRAGRNEMRGEESESTGDLQAAEDSYHAASTDLLRAVLLRSHAPPEFPVEQFDAEPLAFTFLHATDQQSADLLAKAASLEFRAAKCAGGDAAAQSKERAFTTAYRLATSLVQSEGLLPAVDKVFSMIHGVGLSEAQPEVASEFLFGLMNAYEKHLTFPGEPAHIAWYAAWLFTQKARSELYSPARDSHLEKRKKFLEEAIRIFEEAYMGAEAQKLRQILTGTPTECEKPPANFPAK
jgi:hypothetical protein